jgi:hypothetical protein
MTVTHVLLVRKARPKVSRRVSPAEWESTATPGHKHVRLAHLENTHLLLGRPPVVIAQTASIPERVTPPALPVQMGNTTTLPPKRVAFRVKKDITPHRKVQVLLLARHVALESTPLKCSVPRCAMIVPKGDSQNQQRPRNVNCAKVGHTKTKPELPLVNRVRVEVLALLVLKVPIHALLALE